MASTAAAPQRTIYIAYLADHGEALAAALRHHGLPAEVLPPPGPESLALGLQLCGGRECFPCFLCLGDIIRRTREPGFEPERAEFLLPTTQGPCRFGQYGALLRDVLDGHGLQAVDVSFPTIAVAHRGFQELAHPGFRDYPLPIRKLTWQGLVAIDLLTRLLHEHRPYELEPGATDAAYRAGLAELVRATEAGGGDGLLAALRRAGERFARLRVDRAQERPLIGLVGEIYVRWNAYSNHDLVREVERLGGEVLVASIAEMIYFSNYRMKWVARISGEWRDVLRAMLVDGYQKRWERKLHATVRHLLRRPDEGSVAALVRALAPYYDAALSTEATLSMGRAIEYARGGASGILNVLPFACMPGVIVAGMAPRIRRDHQLIPWLDIPYDAQKATNIRTRLEAFMHQARQYQRRRATAPADG